MLPPISQGLLPVTTQHDVVKPRNDIPPISPVAPTKESGFQRLLDERQLEQESERRRKRKRALEATLSADSADALTDPLEKGQCVDVKV
ncbi:hypothetical protein IQ22_02737 [Pseudomonas duriflava]|uniref:Uncharacterized protein n=1 Tax=Pseudomonas duriflava TaxID=459528 RepID=A0A562Q9X0_9PSED|nr:aspartate-semialdehyde dehydrogenase [Pseudomonas duriflava]TWI53519.1 hypothetical protein IQ22_02737 [Pseudomonas duriflava]